MFLILIGMAGSNPLCVLLTKKYFDFGIKHQNLLNQVAKPLVISRNVPNYLALCNLKSACPANIYMCLLWCLSENGDR